MAVFPQGSLTCLPHQPVPGVPHTLWPRKPVGRGPPCPSSLCSGEAGPRQLVPVVARKQCLTQGQGPRAELCPRSLPRHCVLASVESVTSGKGSGPFSEAAASCRMALSAAEQGWLEEVGVLTASLRHQLLGPGGGEQGAWLHPDSEGPAPPRAIRSPITFLKAADRSIILSVP